MLGVPFSLQRTIGRRDIVGVNAKLIGAPTDGVTDSSIPISTALREGVTILLAGRTYSIKTFQIFAVPVTIVGPGVLLFDFDGPVGWQFNAGLNLADVEIDGANLNGTPILTYGGVVQISGGRFRRVHRTQSSVVCGARIDTPVSLEISRVRFSEISAPANEIVGDSAGTACGLHITGSVPFGRVDRCVFENIHNRATAGGVLQYEDADAINCYSASGSQTISFSKLRFDNISKRWIKLNNVNASSRFDIEGLRGTSPYIGSPDTADAIGNAMHSAVSIYGGSLTAANVKIEGGGVGFGIEINGATTGAVELTDWHMDVEYRRAANGATSRFIQTTSANPVSQRVSALRCFSNGTHHGCELRGARSELVACDITTVGDGVIVPPGVRGELSIRGGALRHRIDVDPSLYAARGVHVQSTAVTSVTVNDVNVTGKNESVLIATQTSGGKVNLVSNRWVNNQSAVTVTMAAADSQNGDAAGSNNVAITSIEGNQTPGPISGASWTKTGITASAYNAGGYSTVAKSTGSTNAFLVRSLLRAGVSKSTVTLLAGTSTQADIGLMGPSVPATGSASVVSGPGTVTQINGTLTRVTGLSASVPTVVELVASSSCEALYAYPDTAPSTEVGSSVLLRLPVTVRV